MTYRNLSNIFKTILAVAFLAILPGMGMAQTNNFSDIKPGSILFFNRYTSNPINPLLGDTQINITNLNQNKAVALHLYMIDGSSCSVADSPQYLEPSQTLTILMSDFDPGTFGYMIVVAENAGMPPNIPATGLPTQHNWLAGTALVREFDGRQAILSAISIAKVSAGDIAPDPDGQYRLKFNGAIYDKLPQTLAIPSFDSPVSTTTFLYVYAPSTNIYVGDATAASISALVFNDASGSLSGSFSLTCYRQDSLSNYFRGGGVTRQVPNSGRTGWVRLHSANAPILGSVISRNSMFQGGYNLTAIALYGNHEIVVPNF